jgi:hypothetical protein
VGIQVVNGASTMCSMGLAPGSLVVVPANRTMAGGQPAANIMDNKPMVNVMPFGNCMSLANPITAAQTAAALGVLTPGTCIPVLPAPWTPGAPKSLIANMPALTESSICTCAYGGVVKITVPGQTSVMVS